ncbi:uncharacterized protein PpBr36_09178 [Pyricularia pennisetigena]|uniref:uncharacterized protein n=1 Tax=Pyricularia pennisetigena TaxID=1578925 RepID=UPI0011502C32|nr:uncharacterized protein PpBr36_09178 [Pyricularia pennisetigena]TLS22030.1 hypothetical protein PpBr36_09178 [Pyricularia pennisetigena]
MQANFTVAELVGIVIGSTAAVLIIASVIMLSVIRRRRRRRETEVLDWGYQPQTWEETWPRQSQATGLIPQQPVMRQATPPMDLSPIFSPTSAHNLEEALLRAERVNSYPQPEPQPYRYSQTQTTSPTSATQYHHHHQLPGPPAPIIVPFYHHQQQQQQQQQQEYTRKEIDSISRQSPTYSSPQQRFARATMASNAASSRQSSTRSSRRDWPLQRQDSTSGGFRRLSTLSGRIRGGRHIDINNRDSPAELWTTANVAEMDDTQTPRPRAPSFFESPVLGTAGLHVSIVNPKQSRGSLRTGSARSGG